MIQARRGLQVVAELVAAILSIACLVPARADSVSASP